MSEYRPVLIVSPPRSGSSLTASMVASLGLFGGLVKPGDHRNERGYFENVALTDLVVTYLRRHDIDRLGKRFQPLDLDADYEDFGEVVLATLRREGLRPGERWYFKDPKIALCWSLWHRHFPRAQWVIVQRQRSSLIGSLLRTDMMDAYETREQWEQFLGVYDRLLKNIQDACDSFTFNIESVFTGNRSAVENLLGYVARGYVDSAMARVDAGLWHGA